MDHNETDTTILRDIRQALIGLPERIVQAIGVRTGPTTPDNQGPSGSRPWYDRRPLEGRNDLGIPDSSFNVPGRTERPEQRSQPESDIEHLFRLLMVNLQKNQQLTLPTEKEWQAADSALAEQPLDVIVQPLPYKVQTEEEKQSRQEQTDREEDILQSRERILDTYPVQSEHEQRTVLDTADTDTFPIAPDVFAVVPEPAAPAAPPDTFPLASEGQPSRSTTLHVPETYPVAPERYSLAPEVPPFPHELPDIYPLQAETGFPEPPVPTTLAVESTPTVLQLAREDQGGPDDHEPPPPLAPVGDMPVPPPQPLQGGQEIPVPVIPHPEEPSGRLQSAVQHWTRMAPVDEGPLELPDVEGASSPLPVPEDKPKRFDPEDIIDRMARAWSKRRDRLTPPEVITQPPLPRIPEGFDEPSGRLAAAVGRPDWETPGLADTPSPFREPSSSPHTLVNPQLPDEQAMPSSAISGMELPDNPSAPDLRQDPAQALPVPALSAMEKLADKTSLSGLPNDDIGQMLADALSGQEGTGPGGRSKVEELLEQIVRLLERPGSEGSQIGSSGTGPRQRAGNPMQTIDPEADEGFPNASPSVEVYTTSGTGGAGGHSSLGSRIPNPAQLIGGGTGKPRSAPGRRGMLEPDKG